MLLYINLWLLLHIFTMNEMIVKPFSISYFLHREFIANTSKQNHLRNFPHGLTDIVVVFICKAINMESEADWIRKGMNSGCNCTIYSPRRRKNPQKHTQTHMKREYERRLDAYVTVTWGNRSDTLNEKYFWEFCTHKIAIFRNFDQYTCYLTLYQFINNSIYHTDNYITTLNKQTNYMIFYNFSNCIVDHLEIDHFVDHPSGFDISFTLH